MTSEQMVAWIIQNAYALFIGALITAIAEILFKVFIWDDYISPSFRFRLNYYKNKLKKWVQNSTTELSYSSRSVDIESLAIKIEKITDIVNQLRVNKIPALGSLDITIENYETGKMSMSGSIKFSTITHESKGEILKDFTITLTTQLRYQSMNDEIPAHINTQTFPVNSSICF